MAKRLRAATFSVATTEPAIVDKILTSGRAFKNCYWSALSEWQIKLYLGKQQRIIAKTPDKVAAVRFADMAIAHFWRYRKILRRPLEDSDLNFGLEHLAKDRKDNPWAVQLLIEIEQQMIRDHILLDDVKQSEVDVRSDFVEKRKLFVAAYRKAIRRFGELESYPSPSMHLSLLKESLDTSTKLVNAIEQLKV